MRLTLSLCIFILLFPACQTYQYLTLDSDQAQKNKEYSFSWENDTTRLNYTFSGDGGNLNLVIYNKSTQPMYINWQKSALIRDDRSFSLFDPNASFSGVTVGTHYVHNISGVLALPNGMDFIPPGSSITKALLPIARTGSLITYLPDSIRKHAATEFAGGDVKFREVSFDETRSPVRFKSYLTFMLGSDHSSEFAECQSFYVSRVIETDKSPQMFGFQGWGDRFFIHFPSNP